MDVPGGQSLYSYCSNITMEEVHNLVLMRGITGIVCFCLCLLSFVLEIIQICRKKESTVLQRFFVYVIASNLLRAALLSMDVFSHKDSVHVNEKFCEIIGFFSQYFASFQLLTIIAMMLLLFHNLFKINLKYKQVCSNFFNKFRYTDVFIIIVLFLSPSLYTWVPFVLEGGIYGDAGPWCWLKAYDANCSEIGDVFVLESVFWNFPFGIVLMFCFVCVSIYLIFFIYISFCQGVYRKKLSPILVDTCILFLFFAFYSSLCVIEISALIFVHTRKTENSYSWLVLYAITLPIGEISLSLSSFVHFFRILCKQGRTPPKMRHYNGNIVSKLSRFHNIESSQRISAKSYTSQQERPAFVSPSTSVWTNILPETSSNYGATE